LAHLDEVRHKIADLVRLEAALSHMAEQCSGGRVAECPVIDTLFAPSASQP
jgi:MerR family mercuric resistance operon transcriptional regulator